MAVGQRGGAKRFPLFLCYLSVFICTYISTFITYVRCDALVSWSAFTTRPAQNQRHVA